MREYEVKITEVGRKILLRALPGWRDVVSKAWNKNPTDAQRIISEEAMLTISDMEIELTNAKPITDPTPPYTPPPKPPYGYVVGIRENEAALVEQALWIYEEHLRKKARTRNQVDPFLRDTRLLRARLAKVIKPAE